MQHRGSGRSWLVVLPLALAACGSDGSSGGPSVSPTPAPTTTSLPSPAATQTPIAGAGIEPMLLLEPGTFASAYATGVNARGWISIHHVQSGGPMIVLPPDAGPGAGDPPVPGCPVGAASPACARGGVEGIRVGESDWYVGDMLPRPRATPLPTAFGADGEVAPLVPCCDPTGILVGETLPVPGGRFLGKSLRPVPGRPGYQTVVPVLWRAPGTTWEPLPTDGYAAGTGALAADAAGRIAGQGVPDGAPAGQFVPLLWAPRDESFEIVRLPLLDGGVTGSAVAIDTRQIAGSSDGASGTKPVVWEATPEDGWRVRELPIAESFRTCTVVATSGDRIAGNCALASLRERAVVWRRAADGWRIETLLNAPGGIDSAYANAMSGDLVVGVAGNVGGAGTAAGPVAWRLPREDVSP